MVIKTIPERLKLGILSQELWRAHSLSFFNKCACGVLFWQTFWVTKKTSVHYGLKPWSSCRYMNFDVLCFFFVREISINGEKGILDTCRCKGKYICLVTMLEQYACTRLIEYLTFSGLFQEKKVFRIIVELLDYLLVFTAIISY